MFQFRTRQKTMLGVVFTTLELIFHCAVREMRRSHGNAMLGLVMSIVKTMLLTIIMYFTFQLLGIRRVAVRGDFMLYVMSGVFLFMTYSSAIGAVSKADGPGSMMMLHSPMNPIISILGAGLASLYKQTLSAMVIMFLYHALFVPISIEQPTHALGVFMIAWGSGLGVGMVLRSMRPWQPELASILTTVIMRVNIFASGKMLLGNNVPTQMRPWFEWNPLFHLIDQARGFIFLNYSPYTTSLSYAVEMMLVCITIGLMVEFFTKQHISASWGARR